MKTLEEKIEHANWLIGLVTERFSNPVVMSSFGKDSMVMLDLLKRTRKKLPVLFHREPFSPEKYAFANRVILENGYTVYDYQPTSVSVVKNNGKMEIVNWYQVGQVKTAYLPTGIREPEEGKDFLCGYKDLYLKPTGTFVFPWDVVFVGHKSSDVDPIVGPIPLRVDININHGAPAYAFPLRHFTDADIWEYHEKFGVPVHESRYNRNNGFKEHADISGNPDWFHACTLCMDRDSGPSVFCPMMGCEIPNISGQLHYIEPGVPGYIGREG